MEYGLADIVWKHLSSELKFDESEDTYWHESGFSVSRSQTLHETNYRQVAIFGADPHYYVKKVHIFSTTLEAMAKACIYLSTMKD